METRIFDTKEAVARGFSEYLAELIGSRQQMHIALSGGSTPKIVFDYLAGHFAGKIAWENVHFYWGDERCVPPTDAESNFKMTQEHLLSKIDIPRENIHRIQGENDPEAEATRYASLLENQLPTEHGTPKFDLVILGMGDDGHTASIFPDSIEQWDARAHCVTVAHPESGQIRVSLSGRVINQADRVVFLVTGKGKAEKVQEIFHEAPSSKAYPARLVAPKSGNLIWFLDQEAGSLV